MVHNAKKEIVEKIVEREVVKEVRVGISDEEMAEIRRKAEEEKQMLMKQAQDDMRHLIDQQSRTAQERAELQAALDREAEDRRLLEEQKLKLNSKLKVKHPTHVFGQLTVLRVVDIFVVFFLLDRFTICTSANGGEAVEGW
jgi:hypothetical protein